MMNINPTTHLTKRTTALDPGIHHGWPQYEPIEGGFLFGSLEGQ